MPREVERLPRLKSEAVSSARWSLAEKKYQAVRNLLLAHLLLLIFLHPIYFQEEVPERGCSNKSCCSARSKEKRDAATMRKRKSRGIKSKLSK